MQLDSDTFDVIVLGTGLTQSIVSGALARAGKKVLHLDENEFYGEKTASFNIETLLQHLKREDEAVLSQDFLQKQSRYFSLDLIPRLYFARGTEIKLLISSGVSRYLEFKATDGSYISINGDLELVPCSKADLFKSKSLTLLDKRNLKRFFDTVVEEPEPRGEADDTEKIEQTAEEREQTKIDSKNTSNNNNSNNNNNNNNMLDCKGDDLSSEPTFYDYLKKSSLSDKLQNIVFHALGFIDSDQSVVVNRISQSEGLRRLKLYITSLGVYSPSPFLASMYGFGEFPQAFCRLAAVYGATFVLRQKPRQFNFDSQSGDFVSLDTEAQTLKAPYLITSASYVEKHVRLDVKKISLSRCIAVVDSSLVPSQNTLVCIIPPHEFANENAIFMLQFGFDLGVAAKSSYVIHFTCIGSNAHQDLQKAVSHYTQKMKVLMSLFFNMEIIDQVSVAASESSPQPKNVFVCSDSTSGFEFRKNIDEAQKIFDQIAQGSDFLPTVPDPENFVWENEPEKE